MKKFTVIFFLSFVQLLFPQKKFFETSWSSGGNTYTGLLVYSNDNNSFMRVKYTINGVGKLAEFKCYKIPFNEDGIKGYYWDGRDARMIRGGASGYNADNFYFIDKGGVYSAPMHIDDYGLKQSNKAQYYHKVNYWKEVKPSIFTNKYLSGFFNKYEKYYDELIMLKLTSGSTVSSLSNVSNNDLGFLDKTASKLFDTNKSGYVNNSNRANYYEKYIIKSNFPKDDIKSSWDNRYNINSVAFGNDKWILDLSKKDKYKTQRWFTRKIFPKEDITKGWKDGYTITSITYGDGVWATVMTKDSGLYSQSWKTRVEYPREEIDQLWKEGKSITNLTYKNGVWVLVMSKGSGFYNESISRSVDFPKDKIKTNWDKGKQITSLTYGNGKWILVMAKGAKSNLQRWRTRSFFPKEDIEKGWKDGYEITSLAYNNKSKKWALVLSKMK